MVKKMARDDELLSTLKDILEEMRLLRKAIENARPPSPLVINRLVDRDPYPPVTPPPIGWGIPSGMPPPPGPPGLPGPIGFGFPPSPPDIKHQENTKEMHDAIIKDLKEIKKVTGMRGNDVELPRPKGRGS
jgi:hypothetical protein